MYKFSSPNICLSSDDYKEINEIIKSGQVCLGKNVLLLENIFKTRFKVKYAISCASATAGLIISIKAAGIKNMKVALPSFTWPSTLYAIECNRNTPVFCDINKETWLMKVDKKCDAVVPVDTFGAQYENNNASPNLSIYDAAHGFDLPLLGHRGLAEVVSLSFTKLVTAMQGGIILTNDDIFAEKSRELMRLSAKITEVDALVAINSIKNYDNLRKVIVGRIIERYNVGFKFEFNTQFGNINNSVYTILFKSQGIRNEVSQNL
ncbi:MAG: DegT/DnrJ/EryC1/StrS family aminotransferase, partial [bacterium]|nr:DegT/DnrJ/EryC1/StrS family aminotransferase [bacterium]